MRFLACVLTLLLLASHSPAQRPPSHGQRPAAYQPPPAWPPDNDPNWFTGGALPGGGAPPTLAGQMAEIPIWAYLVTAAVLVLISRPRRHRE